MSLKPIKLYTHSHGPNPWKVKAILLELGLPFEEDFVAFSRVKQSPFIDLNPNGRIPAIEDPNTGIVMWESGAIIEYLIAKYDKEHTLSYSTEPEIWEEKKWLHFQMSGQGPYFGQAVWFRNFHSEKLPSAIERYGAEVRRVVSVLDLALKGREFLVGDKCTYVDIAFMPWQTKIPFAIGEEAAQALDTDFPAWKAWTDRVLARPATKKVIDEMIEAANGPFTS